MYTGLDIKRLVKEPLFVYGKYMDKYSLPLHLRQNLVQTQIQEQQTIIYRNHLENLGFIAEGNKHKQTEVKTNNEILSEKIDLLLGELERLNAEDKTGSDTPV